MSIRIISGNPKGWRPHRFATHGASEPGAPPDPQASRQAIADGFEQGNQRGYCEGLEQGNLEGRREGQAVGHEAGMKAGLASFELASQPLERIHRELRVSLANLETERQLELLALVRKVAEQVIRCELTLHPTQLLTLAEEALAALPEPPREVCIHLHPEECARIKAVASERAAAWRLVPDEALALGECRIVTEREEIDIGCQQRLDACVETLTGHLLPEGG